MRLPILRSLLTACLLLTSALNVAAGGAPSDSYSDADAGQSSYVGGAHNMDPAIVDSAQFGILWQIKFNNLEKFYAKPLVYTPTGQTQQVFLASTQNIVRSIDAKTGTVLLTRTLGEPFKQSDIGCTDIPDTIGIIGTPIIDPKTDIMYLYSKQYIPNYRVAGQYGMENGVYYFYAIDTKTLNTVDGFPILVDGTVADNDPRRYFIGGTVLQRPALAQYKDFVYAGFGGHCDLFNYTGLIVGVDVVQKKVVADWTSEWGPNTAFNLDYRNSNGGGGGIWQGGNGIATDGSRLFIVTGNGQGHENNGVPASGQSGCRTLGEAAINLAITDDGKVKAVDYFQPYDYQNMDGGDQDFGSGGLSLLDTTVFKGTNVARMAITAGKNGKIYILNADNLGGYKNGAGGVDGIIQTVQTNKAVFGGGGSYPGNPSGEGAYIYYTPVGYPTYAYKLGFDDTGKPLFTQAGMSTEKSAGRVGVGIPTITSYQGKPGSAILWMTDPDAGLRAWYAVPKDGNLTSIKMPAINGINKFQRPAFGDTRLYTTSSTGILYCIGSPVNLPLNCTGVDFGGVPLGSAKTATVDCKTLIPITSFTGMSVGDARFEVDNSTLPKTALAKGATFSIPVRWNLTSAVVQDTAFASYGSVTPGIKSTPLTIFTVNGQTGFATSYPVSLSGNQVSQKPFLDVSPSTLDFEGLVLGLPGGNPMKPLTFTIANLGISSLTVLGYAYTTDEATDPTTTWTNATFIDGQWTLGEGFAAAELPAIGSHLLGGSSSITNAVFSASQGVGEYLSYFKVYTTGGDKFIILEGSASTAPKARLEIQKLGEAGYYPETVTDMDFGVAAPGNSVTIQMRLCNDGGSTLIITKSKPPLGVIRAPLAGIDFHESQEIYVGDCANASVTFAPKAQQVNIRDFQETESWTLNTNDLDFGVHVIGMKGIVRGRQVGELLANTSARFPYMGCYLDSPRLLTVQAWGNQLQENGKCINKCISLGYQFAGTEYQQQCYCGNKVPESYKFYPESDQKCTFTCNNDTSQACGGNGGYISVFYDSTKFAPKPSDFNNTVNSSAITVPETPNFTHIGCYSEGTNTRALTGKAVGQLVGTGGWIECCSTGCTGYKYFGVENGNECYCGNTVTAGSALIGSDPVAAGCSTRCTGNLTEYCGGSKKLNMYQAKSTLPTSTSSSLSSTSTTANSTSLSTSSSITMSSITSIMTTTSIASSSNSSASSMMPSSTTFNSTSSSLTTSTLSNSSTTSLMSTTALNTTTSMPTISASSNSSSSTLTSTSALNTTSSIPTLTVSISSSITRTSSSSSRVSSSTTPATSSEISSTTSPSSSSVTTLTSTSSVISSSSSTPTTATAKPTDPYTVQSAGGYIHVGCYNETTGRTLNAKTTTNTTSMTVEYCASFCSAYTYFGVEYSQECYCGNSIGIGAALQMGSTPALTGCSKICKGDALEYCGGSSKLNLYQKQSTVVKSSSSSKSSSSTSTSSSSSSSGSSLSSFSSSLSTSAPTTSSTSATSSGSTSVTSMTSMITSSDSSITSTVFSSTSSSSSLAATTTSSFSMTSSDAGTTTTSSSSSTSLTSLSSSTISDPPLTPSISPTGGNLTATSTTSAIASNTPAPITCPQMNQTLYTTVNGTYMVECGINRAGSDISGASFTALTFQTCVDWCTANPKCACAVWQTGPKKCYPKSAIGGSSVNSGVNAIRLVSRPSSTISSLVARATAKKRVRFGG